MLVHQIHPGKVHANVYNPFALFPALLDQIVYSLVNMIIQLSDISAFLQSRNKFRRRNTSELTAEPSGQSLCQRNFPCPGIVNRLIVDLYFSIPDRIVQMKKSDASLLIVYPHLFIKNRVRLHKLIGNIRLGNLGTVAHLSHTQPGMTRNKINAALSIEVQIQLPLGIGPVQKLRQPLQIHIFFLRKCHKTVSFHPSHSQRIQKTSSKDLCHSLQKFVS